MGKVTVNVAKTAEGYTASTNILPGWVLGTVGSFDEFQKELKESIDMYVKWAKEDGDEYPAIFAGEYEFDYQFDVESLLCCYAGIFTRSAMSRLTGINEKQLGHYACGRSLPRPAQRKKITTALHKLGKELMAVSV